ncbi:hypothetical protein [Mycolicibacterium sp. 018/SC-01/001]|uniref:hypothetical protein n=1 Tax=Mycolicibacterium sp. 018/SC-01/001 TaxID=2592069 RepID=UPI00163D6404|nr:hypothetical protein [Mycolicibacterium sp. 018/SC-01/001]
MLSNHMSYAVVGTRWFPRAFAQVHPAPAAISGATAAAATRKRRAAAGTAVASVRDFH